MVLNSPHQYVKYIEFLLVDLPIFSIPFALLVAKIFTLQNSPMYGTVQ